MMNGKVLSLAVIGIMVCCAVACMPSSDGETGFDITDGTGKTFHYNGPSDHIVSTGYAVSHTLYQLGVLDKVVATDQYGSKDYAESHYNDYTLGALEGIPNLGSMFSESFLDEAESAIVQMKGKGIIDFDDTIILTTSSKMLDLREKLESYGFTHVLVYKSIDDYNKIIDMMEAISLATTGAVDKRVDRMADIADNVGKVTSEADPAKAIYVWYNSKGLAVGNTGIMSSMLGICNTEQIGLDTSIDKGYYGGEADIIDLISKNKDAVVFINNSYFSAGNTISDFRDKFLGGDRSIKLVEMDELWNNYSLESADALQEIAGILYPDLFGGEQDPSDEPGSNGSNIALYAGAAIAVIAVVGVAAYMLMRKP